MKKILSILLFALFTGTLFAQSFLMAVWNSHAEILISLDVKILHARFISDFFARN